MAAQITALPTAPSITDPANFETRADALVGSIVYICNREANARRRRGSLYRSNTKSSDASTFVTNASNSATTATTSCRSRKRSNGENAAGAAKWLVVQRIQKAIQYIVLLICNLIRNSGAPAAGGADPASNPTWWVMIGTVVPSFVYINIMGLI